VDPDDPLAGLADGLPGEPVDPAAERSAAEGLLGHVYRSSDISEDEFDMLLDLVAHEIRTPFALIEGRARLLLHGTASDDVVEESVRSIHRSAVLGLLLLDRLRELRAVDEERVNLNRLPLDVGEHVRRTAEMLSDPVLGPRPLEVRVDEGGPFTCEADPSSLRQILFNLLANAALNTPPGAPIFVLVGEEDGNVEVIVRDDGHGVAPDDAEELFERFPRLNASRQGPGVGLYVSRGLAVAHGGDLRAVPTEDSDGGGIFVLSLPCADEG
jgi:signal transduction histidine kinase